MDSVLPGEVLRFIDPESGFFLDISGMDLPRREVALLTAAAPRGKPSPMGRVHAEMQRIEAGEIKNPDEGRKVTHFTDRRTYLQSAACRQVLDFVATHGPRDGHPGAYHSVIVNGIGGSALGPQLLQWAVNGPYWNELSDAARRGFPRVYFLDNTDPAGVRDIRAAVDLRTCLVVTVSKSGGTQETLNNLRALEAAFRETKIDFAPHAAAVTMPGSKLDEYAREQKWVARFPMAESIGGRTSETNIVGHVPAALAGIDFPDFIAGALHMDGLTREPALSRNPAYLLAAAWYIAGNGRGDRNMVVVPYSDRLLLFSRYLQQLVMESLGKERDLDGMVVHQGLTVYGNKGGTDAHAYIQQLNDGRNDFFATFVEVLRDAADLPVGDGMNMGDYLHAFKQGLKRALRGKGRKVIDVVIPELSPYMLGMLIALYERAVAAYAELIHINAFHQPGVQAYKLAAGTVADLHGRLVDWIAGKCPCGWQGTARGMAAAAGFESGDVEEIEALLSRYACNDRGFGGKRVLRRFRPGTGWEYQVTGKA